MKKLVKVALIVGGAALVSKVLSDRKSRWSGLSETEVREKLDARLPPQVPEEKRSTIADKVVAKMERKGMLREDEPSDGANEVGKENGVVASDPVDGDEAKDGADPA